MTSEYSQQISWFDWSDEWKLDKDDEEQLIRDIDETKEIINYVQRKLKNGAKSNKSEVTE